MNSKNETQSLSTSKRSKVSRKSPASGLLVTYALLLLSAIPIIAGAFRLNEMASGAEITPENARFFEIPLPMVLHIISASIFTILGAFQFASGFRMRWPGWHRAAGKFLVICGLVSGITALWIVLVSSRPPGTGDLLYAFRLIFGSAFVVFIYLGFTAIRKGDVIRHSAWMIRGYAIGIGTGTNVLTQLVGLLIFGPPNEMRVALQMLTSWLINLAVAEWVIRKRLAPPARPNK